MRFLWWSGMIKVPRLIIIVLLYIVLRQITTKALWHRAWFIQSKFLEIPIRSQMVRSILVQSDQNIWVHLWRCCTLTDWTNEPKFPIPFGQINYCEIYEIIYFEKKNSLRWSFFTFKLIIVSRAAVLSRAFTVLLTWCVILYLMKYKWIAVHLCV